MTKRSERLQHAVPVGSVADVGLDQPVSSQGRQPSLLDELKLEIGRSHPEVLGLLYGSLSGEESELFETLMSYLPITGNQLYKLTTAIELLDQGPTDLSDFHIRFKHNRKPDIHEKQNPNTEKTKKIPRQKSVHFKSAAEIGEYLAPMVFAAVRAKYTSNTNESFDRVFSFYAKLKHAQQLKRSSKDLRKVATTLVRESPKLFQADWEQVFRLKYAVRNDRRKKKDTPE